MEFLVLIALLTSTRFSLYSIIVLPLYPPFPLSLGPTGTTVRPSTVRVKREPGPHNNYYSKVIYECLFYFMFIFFRKRAMTDLLSQSSQLFRQ